VKLEEGKIYAVKWHGGNFGEYIAIKSRFGDFRFHDIKQPEVFVGFPNDAEAVEEVQP